MNLERLNGKIPQGIIDQIPTVTEKFAINTPLRLAHFLSQCSHESGGFKITKENLNYSAKGLCGIFKKYFTPESAAEYQRKPEKIANIVYANRMGNGNQASGDGYKFLGRGALQITGRDNYTALSKDLGVDFVTNPDLVAKEYSLVSAGWFFSKNKLNAISDLGTSEEVITKLTKRINGGTIGLPHRIEEFKTFYKLLV